MSTPTSNRAFTIALAYAVCGIAYIIGSDAALQALLEPEDIIRFEALKGIGFILFTAVVLFLLLHRFQDASQQAIARAEAASAARRDTLEALPNIYFETGLDGVLVTWNRRGREVTGLSDEELGASTGLSLLAPEDRHLVEEVRGRLYSTKRPQLVEARLLNAYGQRLPYLWHIAPRYAPDGEVLGMVGIGIDIARLRKAEETARAEERKFRLLFDKNPLPMLMYNRDTLRFVEVNDAALELYGYSRKEIMALTVLDIRPEEDRDAFALSVASLAAGTTASREWRHLTKDGRSIDVNVTAAWTTFNGQPVVISTVRDLTLERELRARLEQAINAMSEGFVMVDSDDRLVLCNQRYREMFAGVADLITPGAAYETWVRASAERGFIDIGDQTVDEYLAERLKVHRRGTATTLKFGDRTYAFRDRELPDGGFVGIRTDITDMQRAEEELHRRNEILHAAGRLAGMGYWRLDVASGLFEESEEISSMRGTFPGEVQTLERFLDHTHDDDRQSLRRAFGLASEKGTPIQVRARIRTLSGDARTTWIEGQPTVESNGRVTGVFGILQDVTERDETEARIEQYKKTLAHAHKMDALGQLTGGVAHDFNNLLLVILGNLDMLRESAELDAEAVESIDVALKAARRGSDLTQRLLAYSRQQQLRPTIFDLNASIRETAALLRSSVGATIDIRLNLDADAPSVMADRNQFETALLNLALNARDAMPTGGHLLIESDTVDVDPQHSEGDGRRPATSGTYALVKVTDTGCGIEPEKLEHVFEPFFTTKAVGEGTGLGLSMVYGFVTQSEGFVDISSEVGLGTSVKLYFPVCNQAPDVTNPRDPGQFRPSEEQSYSVLLVEDEDEIRSMISRFLEGSGCKVHAAADGIAAMNHIDSDAPIDVLVTDIVLPSGLGGRALAETALAKRPGLGVVFMSGYPALRDTSDWLATTEHAFLEKPFKLNALWAAIQETVRATDGTGAERG